MYLSCHIVQGLSAPKLGEVSHKEKDEWLIPRKPPSTMGSNLQTAEISCGYQTNSSYRLLSSPQIWKHPGGKFGAGLLVTILTLKTSVFFIFGHFSETFVPSGAPQSSHTHRFNCNLKYWITLCMLLPQFLQNNIKRKSFLFLILHFHICWSWREFRITSGLGFSFGWGQRGSSISKRIRLSDTLLQLPQVS